MATHPFHADGLRASSPLAAAQRRTKLVGRRNARVMWLALLGMAIAVTLACLALWSAAHRA